VKARSLNLAYSRESREFKLGLLSRKAGSLNLAHSRGRLGV
jgi:hypothetical protein